MVKSSENIIDNTTFQLLINRISEGNDRTVNSVKSSLQDVDVKIFKSIKDLTKVVNDNKKNTEKIDKTVADHSKKIDALENVAEKQSNSLDDIISIQNRIIEKIDNSEKTFGKKISDLQNMLQRQTEALERDIEKVEIETEKANKSVVPNIMSALGGAAGVELFKKVFPIAIAGVFGAYMGNLVGRKINEALKPIKHALGYTAENFPEMAKLSERLKTGGISNVLSEEIKQLQGESAVEKTPINVFSLSKTTETDPDAEKVNVPSEGGPAIGTGRGPGTEGGPTAQKITGNASEALSFFVSKGWTKEQAAGIVGNLQVESGNFASDVLSGTRKGDGGVAVGVAQWHPDRQAKFAQVFGKSLIGSSFKEQLEFVNWELNNSEKKAGDRLRQSTDARSAAAAVDQFYERSSGEARSQRMSNAASLSGSKISETTPQQPSNMITPKASTSDATQVTSPTPMNTEAPKTLPDGRPVQAQIPGSETKSGDIPKGDIVALGKYLQSQGVLISEHPAFGGVKAGGHVTNSAHYRGEAIDINAPGGIVEANDPVWSKKFDAIAEELRSAGYKVLWKTNKGGDHFNHLHAQIGGSSTGHEAQDQGTTGAGTSPTTPASLTGGQQMSPPTPMMGTGMPGMGMGMPGMGMMGGMGMGGGMGMLAGLIGPLAGSLLNNLMQPNIQTPQINPQEQIEPAKTPEAAQNNVNIISDNKNMSQKVLEANEVTLNSRPDWLGDLAEGLFGSTYSGMSRPKYFGAGVGKV